MIYLVHRGWGGRYTNYVSANVKNICRMRRMELTTQEPSNGYKVAVCESGGRCTEHDLKEILKHPKVVFYIGDSKGLPNSVIQNADEIISVSSLDVCHQLEAAILTSAIEQSLINSKNESIV